MQDRAGKPKPDPAAGPEGWRREAAAQGAYFASLGRRSPAGFQTDALHPGQGQDHVVSASETRRRLECTCARWHKTLACVHVDAVAPVLLEHGIGAAWQEREPPMDDLRRDYDATDMRDQARLDPDPTRARRFAALADLYDGLDPAATASKHGATSDILREWVATFNGRGFRALAEHQDASPPTKRARRKHRQRPNA